VFHNLESTSDLQNIAIKLKELTNAKDREEYLREFEPSVQIEQTFDGRALSRIDNLLAIDPQREIVLILLDEKEFESIEQCDAKRQKATRVVGLGFGAAKLFSELGLENSGGHCAHGEFGTPKFLLVNNISDR
jgi:ATP-dependent 26S proteasome regulatory subunit